MNEAQIVEAFERIERENRRLKRTLCVLALVLPFLFCMAAAPEAQFFKTLKVQTLNIVDTECETRASIETGEYGTGLFMTPAGSETDTISIIAGPDGSGTVRITAPFEADRSGIILTNRKDFTCGLHIADKGGKERVLLGSDESAKPIMALGDAAGTPQLAVNISEDGSTNLMLMGGKKLDGSALLSVLADGSTSLSLQKKIPSKGETEFSGTYLIANDPSVGSSLRISDEKGKERIQMCVDAEGDEGLSFSDGKERERLSLAHIEDMSILSFHGPDGKARMAALNAPDILPSLSWLDENKECTRMITGEDEE